MPIRTKPALLNIFENSLRESGLVFLRLSEEREHPAIYQIINGENSYRIRVYIWNLTFGGRLGLPDEWRIQVTGLPEVLGRQRFTTEMGGKTIVLGWCDDLSVFAAYDVSKHLGDLGVSPSIQIRQPALIAARTNGLAPHFRGEEEAAFAVSPRYMGIYLDHMEALHSCASSEEALELLSEICEDPQGVDDQEIENNVPEPRRYGVTSARKALRDAKFKDRILTAYAHTCAMCGIQMRLLDAAHILPAAHPDSTDETSNGIALCALHHRAYDRGLLTFDEHYIIHRNETLARELIRLGLDGGLVDFQNRLLPMINVPPNMADRPSVIYITQVNALRGWVI